MTGPAAPEQTHEFDITAALPGPGTTTLLEASAGTGKTWTIAALVARYVAEGVAPLHELLVVTFTRAASQELRQRVRQRLDEVERALAAAPDAAPPGDDVLLRHLVEGRGAAELAAMRARVRAALADFDAAAILTIHQFCQLVLRGLGVAGDTDAEARLVEDLDDQLIEVVDDLYLRDHADAEHAAQFSRKVALAVAKAAVGDPSARLVPDSAPAGTLAAVRYDFCVAVRAELDRRKRRRSVLSYDDLLGQVRDALVSTGHHGAEVPPAAVRMRERWSIVLIDEFQDTDPVQWEVFDRAFRGHAAMVLIGDPKQAIYGFRGGDVVTYLAAKSVATAVATLGVNRRSDAGVVAGVHALLRNAQLGDAEIVVHDVAAAHQGSRLAGLSDVAPVRLRVVTRELAGVSANRDVPAATAVRLISADVAADIKRLLLERGTFAGEEIQPRHIAVLAHKRRHLESVQQALAAVGVPAVISGGGSIFRTPAATDWLTLLEALEQPHRSDRVRAAALTPFFGHRADALAGPGGEQITEQVSDVVRRWLALLERRGVAAVFEQAVSDGLMARVLGTVGGERLLTDLQHLAQTLHAHATAERLGPVALLAWLHEQIGEEVDEVASDRTRRLDSDAKAVQLVTIHGSKGLEYPFVYLPFLADRYLGWTPDAIRFHDPGAGQARTLDVGDSSGPDRKKHERWWRAEESQESLRTLYVAMTRAQAQLTVSYAPTPKNTPSSPLHRILIGRSPDDAVVPATASVRSDAGTATKLQEWADAGAFVWAEAEPAQVDTTALPASTTPLAAARFRRDVDQGWRRTSYSALSAPAEQHAAATSLDGLVGSEPEVAVRDDERAPLDLTASNDTGAAEASSGTPSPLAGFPAGATFGSLVHEILEHADPDAPDHGGDLEAELRATAVAAAGEWAVDLDPEALGAALVPMMDSPLGPLAPGRTLRSIPMRDRLRELDFELPLGGGDSARPGSGATLGDVAPLLRRHLPEGDPVRAWASALDAPALADQDLRGYLTGSVDVVLRVAAPEGGQRFLIVDYKTNWLGPQEQPLTAEAYGPEALAAAMGHSSYPLQALLYAVVLHRFLRWRLPGYDPAEHLGGVLYLYVRGMTGPDTPVIDGHPCGVFSWQPPVALVTDLSDLLDGRG